jgi:xylan 1,4-beta-xylosidase
MRGAGSLTSLHEVSVLARRVQTPEHEFTVQVHAAPEGPWHGAGIALYYDTRNYFLLQMTATDDGTPTLSLVTRDAGAGPHELLADPPTLLPGTSAVQMRVTTTNLQSQFSVDVGSGWVPIGPELNFLVLSDDHDQTLQFTGPMFAITVRDTLLGQWTATFDGYTSQT